MMRGWMGSAIVAIRSRTRPSRRWPSTPRRGSASSCTGRALLAVRLLHAQVRAHCRRAGYAVDRFDEPVNQEAMVGTLMLFSLGVIKALGKLGVPSVP